MSERERSLAQIHSTHALTRPSAKRVLNLSLAVAGTLGGAVLLSSNVAVLLLAQVGVASWTPLVANAALLFGGVMFAREYRRSR